MMSLPLMSLSRHMHAGGGRIRVGLNLCRRGFWVRRKVHHSAKQAHARAHSQVLKTGWLSE